MSGWESVCVVGFFGYVFLTTCALGIVLLPSIIAKLCEAKGVEEKFRAEHPTEADLREIERIEYINRNRK
jgi:hypothetical protein